MRSPLFIIHFTVFYMVQQMMKWTMKGLEVEIGNMWRVYQTLSDLQRAFMMMLLRGEFVRGFEFCIATNSCYINFEKVTNWHRERTQFVAAVYVRAQLNNLRKRYPMNLVEEIWWFAFDTILWSMTDDHDPLHQWFHSLLVFSHDANFTGRTQLLRHQHLGCAKWAWKDLVNGMVRVVAFNIVRGLESVMKRRIKEKRKALAAGKGMEKEKEREREPEGGGEREGEGEELENVKGKSYTHRNEWNEQMLGAVMAAGEMAMEKEKEKERDEKPKEERLAGEREMEKEEKADGEGNEERNAEERVKGKRKAGKAAGGESERLQNRHYYLNFDERVKEGEGLEAFVGYSGRLLDVGYTESKGTEDREFRLRVVDPIGALEQQGGDEDGGMMVHVWGSDFAAVRASFSMWVKKTPMPSPGGERKSGFHPYTLQDRNRDIRRGRTDGNYDLEEDSEDDEYAHDSSDEDDNEGEREKRMVELLQKSVQNFRERGNKALREEEAKREAERDDRMIKRMREKNKVLYWYSDIYTLMDTGPKPSHRQWQWETGLAMTLLPDILRTVLPVQDTLPATSEFEQGKDRVFLPTQSAPLFDPYSPSSSPTSSSLSSSFCSSSSSIFSSSSLSSSSSSSSSSSHSSPTHPFRHSLLMYESVLRDVWREISYEPLVSVDIHLMVDLLAASDYREDSEMVEIVINLQQLLATSRYGDLNQPDVFMWWIHKNAEIVNARTTQHLAGIFHSWLKDSHRDESAFRFHCVYCILTYYL
jgi:hypothetical protein